jgi:hypothetical protein
MQENSLCLPGASSDPVAPPVAPGAITCPVSVLAFQEPTAVTLERLQNIRRQRNSGERIVLDYVCLSAVLPRKLKPKCTNRSSGVQIALGYFEDRCLARRAPFLSRLGSREAFEENAEIFARLS